jgi:hypothetical protein
MPENGFACTIWESRTRPNALGLGHHQAERRRVPPNWRKNSRLCSTSFSLMGGQRVCGFCGGGKLTIEDPFPKWISRRLGVTGPATTSKAGTPLWHGKVLKVLIRAVCEDCNNGWMSRLENDVSRVIGDSMRNAPAPFALTDPQRETVRAWAVKTALMLELALATLRGSGLAPVSHFKWLYDHRSQPSPPVGFQ